MCDSAAAVDGDNVKTAAPVPQAVREQIVFRHADDRLLFASVNVLFSPPVKPPAAEFYFDKYDRTAVFHNDIDLAGPAAEIGIKKAAAL